MTPNRSHESEPAVPPARPWLADQPSRFMVLEREVEQEFRPRLLAALQQKVEAMAEQTKATPPRCPGCGHAMGFHDDRRISWLARFGRLHARVRRYRCAHCQDECRPLLDVLGVEPGRISGS